MSEHSQIYDPTIRAPGITKSGRSCRRHSRRREFLDRLTTTSTTIPQPGLPRGRQEPAADIEANRRATRRGTKRGRNRDERAYPALPGRTWTTEVNRLPRQHGARRSALPPPEAPTIPSPSRSRHASSRGAARGGAAPPPLMAPKCHRRAAAFSGVRAFLVSRHRAKKLLPRRVASMLLNAKITKAAAIVAPVVFGVPQVDERHGCATEDRVREGSCLLEESKTQTQKSKPGRIHWSISSYRPVPLESPRPVTGPQSGTRRPTPATPDGNDPACRCARPTVRSPLAAITG